MQQCKCATNNFVQSVPFRSCLDNGLKMFPHTPDKTKLSGHRQRSHLKNKNKTNNTNREYTTNSDDTFPCTSCKGESHADPPLTQLQWRTSYRHQTSQTLTHTNPLPTTREQVGQRQLHLSNGPMIQSLEEHVRKSTPRSSRNKLT